MTLNDVKKKRKKRKQNKILKNKERKGVRKGSAQKAKKQINLKKEKNLKCTI